MSKTFRYAKTINIIYLKDIDEYSEDIEFFEYEVNDEDLCAAIADLIYNDYFYEQNYDIVKILYDFILDFDMINDLADYYEDELKDKFRKEAFKQNESI